MPKDVQMVYINVQNQTDEPSIEVAVMKALRAEIQVDGRLTLASREDADVMLNVTLTGYDLQALAYDKTHDTLAREYRVTLTGDSVLLNAETQEVIVESPALQGDDEFPYTTDLTSAKRGALPGAARDFARKAVSLFTTAW